MDLTCSQLAIDCRVIRFPRNVLKLKFEEKLMLTSTFILNTLSNNKHFLEVIFLARAARTKIKRKGKTSSRVKAS